MFIGEFYEARAAVIDAGGCVPVGQQGQWRDEPS
jgi:hypothetical protein